MTKHVFGENCIGCTACEHICPAHAISCDVVSGFIRPIIDTQLCSDCGLCLKACVKNGNEIDESFSQKAYAVKHKDIDVLRKSTSGGAFTAIADYILSVRGVVYGCVLNNNKVVHVRTECDYSGMRGSKYVQSNLGSVFIDIVADIKAGRQVLFTGTPCQCASLKSFLLIKNVSTFNLFLVDFICHGVTSPRLYDDYISYYERKKKKKIIAHLFRSKINGWTKHTEVNCLSDGTEDWQSYEAQLYKSIFYSHYGLNDACFKCNYTSINRVSDITIADFWGIKEVHPEIFDENGVSFLLVNTKKGMTINDYNKKGFDYIVKKYYRGRKINRIISYVYHKLLKR